MWQQEWREGLYHRGEKRMQEEEGTRDKAQRIGEHKAPSMEFLRQRHAVYVASMDPATGRVWSTPIFADPAPGGPIPRRLSDSTPETSPPRPMLTSDVASTPLFCDSCGVYTSASNVMGAFQAAAYAPLVAIDDPALVRVLKPPREDDPLWAAASVPGASVSLNFVEFETRKRYRVNGVVSEPAGPAGFSVLVMEAFSTCPRYIQRRTIVSASPASSGPPRAAQRSSAGDPALSDECELARGADSSHRGGRPGFVRVVDRRVLVWGDFHGKGMNQTLGNTLVHPLAGATFVDWQTGFVLQVSGRLECPWLGEFASLDGTARLCKLSVEQWELVDGMCPFRWRSLDMSTHHPMLRDTPLLWSIAPGRRVDTCVEKWRAVGEEPLVRSTLVGAWPESPSVTTFRFEGERAFVAEPGQYSTFTVPIDGRDYIRCWTLSCGRPSPLPGSKPVPDAERVSKTFEARILRTRSTAPEPVAHERVSVVLHGVEGSFTLATSWAMMVHKRTSEGEDTRRWWKLLTLTGGIGVTPIMSMLRCLSSMVHRGYLAADRMPDVVSLHSEHTLAELLFRDEWLGFVGSDPPVVQQLSIAVPRQSPATTEGLEADGRVRVSCSRIDKEHIARAVPDVAQRTVYLCGPNPFMGAMTVALVELGVPMSRIVTENFEY
eukprot:m51a1_g14421 hypothetical protein (661) ;mRNA; r:486122-488562